MIEFKYPIKLNIDATELQDGTWRLNYQEYFNPEDLEAFKKSYIMLKELSDQVEKFTVVLSELNCCIFVTLEAPRGVVFSFMCGEFFGLSNIAKLTLMDLFAGGTLGALDISGRNVKG